MSQAVSPVAPKVIQLVTRTYECFFEVETGFLRDLRSGNTEIVRAIYGAVRDHNWRTVEPRIMVRELDRTADQFRLVYTADCEQDDIIFRWTGVITGDRGSFRFTFDGSAGAKFSKNRIGLCVLHPIKECAGQPCRVQNSRRKWFDTEYPYFIAPHQPFQDVQRLIWEPVNGLRAEMAFLGEEFETEDQRNWTDASFKTYCTPLRLPYPQTIEKDAKVRQQISLDLTGDIDSPAPENKVPVLRLDSRNLGGALPKLGTSFPAGRATALTERESNQVKKLPLDFLRVELRTAEMDWPKALAAASASARAIGVPLQPALVLANDPEEELLRLARHLSDLDVDSCLIFHENEKSTSSATLDLARRHLPHRLISGTNAYFAELNRDRPPSGFPVAYSINPQVHAFDDLSLIETLEAQPATVQSARQFCDDGLYLGPITLRPRFNPNATKAEADIAGQLPASIDLRQRTSFGAVWALGTLSRLLPLPGVLALNFFEAVGWGGFFEQESGCLLPSVFGSQPNELFPVFHVFEALSEADRLVNLNLTGLDRFAVLSFLNDARQQITLVGNLTPNSVQLTIESARVPVCRNVDAGTQSAGNSPTLAGAKQPGIYRLRMHGYQWVVLECALH